MAFILIVDDDELIAEMACEVLLEAGYACGFVTTAEDAQRLLEARRPDLILLDQDMPGMSGVSLLRHLRGSEDHYDLPVMMFTSIRGQADEDRARHAGAQDYLRKPFTPADLLNRVERQLLKRGQGSPIDVRERFDRDTGFLEEERPLTSRRL